MKIVKLGDLVEFQRGYDLPKNKIQNGKYPVITSNGVLGYHNEYKSGPSVVIGRSGTIGNPQFINEKFWAHNTTLFIKDFKGNDIKYIYYLLLNTDINKMKSGSNIPTLNRNHLHPISINATTDKILQKKIANTLSNIDNKIELNNKTNDELESMAKTIYDYWFLQFEFPNEEGKPYKSSGGKMVWNEVLKREIPEGWSIETLGDLLKNEKKAVLKQDINKKIYTPLDSIPCKKMSLKQIKANGAPNSSLISYEKDALLFGAMRPYFHRVCIVPFEGITRTTVFTLYPKDLLVLGYAFETLNQDSVIKYATDNSIGTQQPYTVWENSLEKMIIPKVPDCLKYMYSKKIEGIIRMVQNNEMESSQLISLRDFLLPLLMNGQVGFKEDKAEG